MSEAALLWIGLTVASAGCLTFSLFTLNRKRRELSDVQDALIEQRTARDLAHERASALEAEVAQLREQLLETKSLLAGKTAILDERESSHQNQVKWIEDSRAALKAEIEVIGQKLLSATGKSLETTNQKSLDSLLKPLAEKIDQFRPNVAKSMFDQSDSEEEEEVETEVDQEPQEDQE